MEAILIINDLFQLNFRLIAQKSDKLSTVLSELLNDVKVCHILITLDRQKDDDVTVT